MVQYQQKPVQGSRICECNRREPQGLQGRNLSPGHQAKLPHIVVGKGIVLSADAVEDLILTIKFWPCARVPNGSQTGVHHHISRNDVHTVAGIEVQDTQNSTANTGDHSIQAVDVVRPTFDGILQG